MPTTPPDARELIHLEINPQVEVHDLECLRARGWRVWKTAKVDDILWRLEAHRDRYFAGLLDLRGVRDPASLERVLPVLTTARIGWVAAIDPGQLKSDAICMLIRDYCHDYVQLPCNDALLAMVLGHAQGMARIPDTGHVATGTETGMEGMVGHSPPMRLMFRALRRAAMTDAPVLITGETGTGKELAASAIHRHSSRHKAPFVAINCGAIQPSLLQSELFGFERGAFTGASQRKRGRIELAHGGTLFLDEIGDLPMDAQASLLRFLQEGTIERLGGHDTINVDARIISATHVDLSVAIDEGRFRADLFHRLCVIELQQPPLRERGDDILLLARHACSAYAKEGRRRIKGFAPCALQVLHAYAWPGNVRELFNRVRQAVVMAETRLITARDLHLDAADGAALETLDTARGEAERTAITSALRRNANRLGATASDLGVSRVTLYRLMIKHGLRDNDGPGHLAATRID